MAEKKAARLRRGAEAAEKSGEDFAQRRAAGGEITSNGVFTKVLRDGHVEVIPTSEVYAKEPDERVEGIEVFDPTVLRGAGQGGALIDRLEREFNTQERGDTVSAKHAQGAAGTIARKEPDDAKLDEGAYEKDQERIAEQQREAQEGEGSDKPKTTRTKKADK
jgi:hypothetical protein